MSITYTDSALVDTIVDALYLKKYVTIIDSLRPTSTFTVNPSEEPFIDLFLEDSERFTVALREAVFRILAQKYNDLGIVKSEFADIKINLDYDVITQMHELSSKHENCVVSFDCQVIATDSPKTYIKSGISLCPLCSREYDFKCNIDREITLPHCVETSCKKSATNVEKKSIVTDDIQTIILQELMENSTNNSPVIFTGKLVGNNIRSSFVGQKKRIVGIFRSKFNKANENDVFIDIISVNDLEEHLPIMPDESLVNKLKEDSKKEEFLDKVAGSFAPNIYGYKDIKKSLLLSLVGGSVSKKRSDINIFLVGDPSMAKSELLKFAKKITPKSIYTSGRGSTAAGLTIGLVKMEDGRLVAMAGVLPICNNGVALIDEFDKMNKDDRSAMHEAMEQQTVSIAKAGIQMTLPSKATIVAAANPKYGMYDMKLTLRDNIDIPSPLLSRFDMIWLIKDKVHVTDDMLKADHILDSFMVEHDNVYLNETDLSGLINYTKKLNPRLTEEAKKEIKTIYEKMRKTANEDDMPVGTRQLESLVRLSMANAKLHFRDDVTAQDVTQVYELITSMYDCFGKSLTGKTQQMMFGNSSVSKQHATINIWDSCRNDKGNVKLKDFQEALQTNGYTEISAKRLIVQWETNNMIKLNDDGTYKRI